MKISRILKVAQFENKFCCTLFCCYGSCCCCFLEACHCIYFELHSYKFCACSNIVLYELATSFRFRFNCLYGTALLYIYYICIYICVCWTLAVVINSWISSQRFSLFALPCSTKFAVNFKKLPNVCLNFVLLHFATLPLVATIFHFSILRRKKDTS